MKNQVFELRRYLENGEVDGVGDLLHEGWCLKQRLSSQITNSEIDVMYHKARQAGAIGGKVLGAGGGGFMMLYCPGNSRYDVMTAMSHFGGEFRKFNFTENGLETWMI